MPVAEPFLCPTSVYPLSPVREIAEGLKSTTLGSPGRPLCISPLSMTVVRLAARVKMLGNVERSHSEMKRCPLSLKIEYVEAPVMYRKPRVRV